MNDRVDTNRDIESKMERRAADIGDPSKFVSAEDFVRRTEATEEDAERAMFGAMRKALGDYVCDSPSAIAKGKRQMFMDAWKLRGEWEHSRG